MPFTTVEPAPGSGPPTGPALQARRPARSLPDRHDHRARPAATVLAERGRDAGDTDAANESD